MISREKLEEVLRENNIKEQIIKTILSKNTSLIEKKGNKSKIDKILKILKILKKKIQRMKQENLSQKVMQMVLIEENLYDIVK